MKRIGIVLFVLSAFMMSSAIAQPTCESLWPNADGLRFTYSYIYEDYFSHVSITGPAWLQFEGYGMTPGGQAQVLLGEHPPLPNKFRAAPYPGLLGQVWRARPDLRVKIAALYGAGAKDGPGVWFAMFLNTGLFLKSSVDIRMWRVDWNHATWTYLDGDISPGASFTMQLMPELADDLFLHGTVEDVAATITTDAGSYTNAVKVAYYLDYGIQKMTDENGDALGLVHPEVRGCVFYVPDVGPVAMRQEYYPFATMDCGDRPCPSEWVPWIGKPMELQTLSLSQTPVPTQTRTWGEVKAMYR